MVVLTTTSIDQIPLLKSTKQVLQFTYAPTIDLSKPESTLSIVNACKSLGFFKVTNHGVNMDLIERLEDGARQFFSLAQYEKERCGSTKAPFGSGEVNQKFPYLLHLGIQSYDTEFLKIYPKLEPTPLQLEEDLEQLKVLENGYKMKVIKVDHDAHGVDTPEDVEKMEAIMREKNIE